MDLMNSNPIDTAVYEVNADYCFTPLGETTSLALYELTFQIFRNIR